MILLDTHVWVWWVHRDAELSPPVLRHILDNESTGLGVSIISCWEVAKLVQYKRLHLPVPVDQWLHQALSYPGIRLLNLTPRIIVESTQLPAEFHRDPADQLIVATARIYRVSLLTLDTKIRNYGHVQTLT